jgi:glycosyltransferase involved in cell wall biosynthesis
MRFVRTPVKVILAGGSSDAKRYEALVKQHGVGDRVTMRGFVSDEELVELYADALAVCYLPFDEDYGYVTLEGMLSAKPVVVTQDSGGAAELIEHGRDGMIVEPDARAIAESLDQLYSNREDATRMGRSGREKLLAMKLSWQNVVKKIISAAE